MPGAVPGWGRHSDHVALPSQARVDGFVIGSPAPPAAYAAGVICSIDFCVADDGDWQGVGRRLRYQVQHETKERGARQVVVVCPHLHDAKRAMLRAAELSLASEWYTAPL